MSLEEKIAHWEITARKLDWPQLNIEHYHDRIWKYCQDFIQNHDERSTYFIKDNHGKHLRQFPISENGYPIDDLMEAIVKDVDQTGINPAHGGHMGYVPGGGVLPAALGDFIVAVTNRYAGIYFANPGAVRMENHLIRWMCDLLGMPKSSSGNLSSGGSIATLTAVVTARDTHRISSGNIRNSTIYMTTYLHHCVNKAIRIAGLAECPIRIIPTLDDYSMNVQALELQINQDQADGFTPFLIFASAGTTDTGAIDPLNDISRIAQKSKAWYHIDAAYGGFFNLLDEVKPAFKGIGAADSIVIDPHKSLFLPYGIGAVLIKDQRTLYATHRYTAAYMQDADFNNEKISPADLSPELTKHFRGMRMWLPLHLIGLNPFKAALMEKILLCRYFYNNIKKLGFVTGPEPKLSIAIFRWGTGKESNSYNQSLIQEIQQDGKVFISSTTIDGIFWLRVAMVCFRTHKHHVDYLLNFLSEAILSTKSANPGTSLV